VHRSIWAVVADGVEGDAFDQPDEQRRRIELGDAEVDGGAATAADPVPVLVQLERCMQIQAGGDAPAYALRQRMAPCAMSPRSSTTLGPARAKVTSWCWTFRRTGRRA
jgi:hypothetical protein